MNQISFFMISVVAIVIIGCRSTKYATEDRPSEWAERIELRGFNNLFKIDEDLYRAEQPNTKDMLVLQQFGIKSILNLRLIQNDNYEARKTFLKLNHVSVNTFKMSYNQVLESIRIIDSAEKPILIHCLHGSDRTGVVVAVYRIVKQGWAKEEAIAEFAQGGYGYHESWFPNLVLLIEDLDVEKLQLDLAADSNIRPH